MMYIPQAIATIPNTETINPSHLGTLDPSGNGGLCWALAFEHVLSYSAVHEAVSKNQGPRDGSQHSAASITIAGLPSHGCPHQRCQFIETVVVEVHQQTGSTKDGSPACPTSRY